MRPPVTSWQFHRPAMVITAIAITAIASLLCWTEVRAQSNIAVAETPKEVAVAVPAKANPAELRVLSYNIHHGEGVDGKLDLQRIARVISSVQPDVVALQEVDCQVTRSRGVDQAQELARLTGMHVAFGANIDLQGGQYGNAVLAREPLGQSRNLLLPNLEQGEQRGVMDVRVSHHGREVRVLATHFDHRRDPAERMASIDFINRLASAPPQIPTLLAGDLNAEFNSPVLDRAREVWKLANSKPLPTIPVHMPDRQIDFVVTLKSQGWRARDVRVLEEAVASDHRAIFAVLELPAQ